MGPAETSLPWLKGWRVSWDLFGLSLWHWRGWKNPRRIVDVETRLEEGKKMGARQERGTGWGARRGARGCFVDVTSLGCYMRCMRLSQGTPLPFCSGSTGARKWGCPEWDVRQLHR